MKSSAERSRKLMISVLATQIQDYMQAKELTNNIEAEHLKLLKLKTMKKKHDRRRAKDRRNADARTRSDDISF